VARMTLRGFRDADAPAVSALIRRCWTMMRLGPYPHEGIRVQLAGTTPERLRETARTTFFLVAVLDGRVVGFGGHDRTHVRLLFVEPAFQRRGIGALLLSRVLEHARREGVAALECNSTTYAVPFYARHGFRRQGTLVHCGVRFTQMSIRLPRPGHNTPGSQAATRPYGTRPDAAEPYLKKHVALVDYTSTWKRAFATEKRLWMGMLGPDLLGIHHIGSTAVPGIKAKPVVDILAVVRFHKRLDELTPVLAAHGYEAKGENRIPGRRYFQKNVRGRRAFHVHAYEKGHPEIETHLLFRDHMRANRPDALAYERLKVKLARRYRNDKKRYGLGKDRYIQGIIAKARAAAGRFTSAPSVTIRRFRPSDARPVSRLISDAYAHFCFREGTRDAIRRYVASYSPAGKTTGVRNLHGLRVQPMRKRMR
jgi:GrpB-like predicted nucleotidyltransferase (UPF0157 family)/GNAT superfamily N-acetyltransferase